MVMIHFTFPYRVFNKGYGYPLLVCFCLSLFGCDSSSSSVMGNGKTVTSTTDQNSNRDADLPEDLADAEPQIGNVDSTNSLDETPSLMDAAKLTDNVPASPDSVLLAADTDSMLEATIIGDYIGILPCTFCDGITITLNLFSDASATKTIAYDNPSTPKLPVVKSGIYRQDTNVITIVYEDKALETYYIQGSHLVMLKSGGSSNTDYTLSRK